MCGNIAATNGNKSDAPGSLHYCEVREDIRIYLNSYILKNSPALQQGYKSTGRMHPRTDAKTIINIVIRITV